MNSTPIAASGPEPSTHKEIFMLKHRYALLTLLILALLCGYLLYPALFFDQSLVHDDNLHHGYALLKFQHDVIYHGLSPLWTNLVYGGHALFAEGQAGLSNPFNYLIAWLLPPEFGHNFIHWLAMFTFGTGCYGLARTLNISPAASMFAALASTFSSLGIHVNSNMIAIEAMAWIPLTLWSFEAWLKKPGGYLTIVFGLTTSMQVFSGYPHFLHGTAIYMLVSASTLFMGGPLRNTLPRILRKYWANGTLAILICVAISSIQWLPLLELASLSHRQEGVEAFTGPSTEYVFRGLLYSTNNFAPSGENISPYFPNTGSLLVCFLASLCLALPSSARMKGHMLATALLLNLGVGDWSPVYTFIKDYRIIPGMDSFRIMFPYLFMSIVGIAVLAANSLDKISRLTKTRLRGCSRWCGARLGAVLLLWCFIIFRLHTPEAPLTNYVIFALGLTGILVLAFIDRLRLLPLCAVLLLLLEIMSLKVVPLGTTANTVLTTDPLPVRYINSVKNGKDFKHFQFGLVALLFASPYSSDLEEKTRHEINNLVASTNLIWGIPSFSAALALKNASKPAVNDVVIREIQGHSDQKPGYRLMDILSVRWISANPAGKSEHLVPILDPDGTFIFWENPYAKPLLQIYQQAQLVDSPEQALLGLEQGSSGLLYIEANGEQISSSQLLSAPTAINLRTHQRTATNYEFSSSADSGYWLFLSDTFHPGWKASIDGGATTVFPAQVLGKTFYVPGGDHQVRLYFQSDSFSLGALLTGTTILCLLAYWIYRLRETWLRHT
jgi:hypothetical protein